MVIAAWALVLAAFSGCRPERGSADAGVVPAVTVVPAERRDVPLVNQYVGTLDGFVNVEIRARVAGFLQTQSYREGTVVGQDQVLFTIDPKQYEAAVADAQGALARARAALANARLTARRLRPLAAEQAVSQQDLDTAVSNEQQASAAVQSAKALLQQAQLNLSYTTIRSPITGLVGIAQVRVGNLVGQGQPTLLTTVSQVDPIRARFAVTEREYLDYQRRLQGKAPQPPPLVQMVLADSSLYPLSGALRFASREVSPVTGTLMLEAVFPNPQQLLRPGQYARVHVVTETLRSAVLVPQRAINALQALSVVAVVDADGTAHVRQVELGPQVENMQVITKGLSGGERVVVEGFGKVRDGQKVKPATALPSPPAAAAPAPGIGGSGAAGPVRDAGNE